MPGGRRLDTIRAVVAPEIVTLPAGIDTTNAGSAGDDLRPAFRPGAAVVIADTTTTALCDSAAARNLQQASDKAAGARAGLRLAIPSATMPRTLTLPGARPDTADPSQPAIRPDQRRPPSKVTHQDRR